MKSLRLRVLTLPQPFFKAILLKERFSFNLHQKEEERDQGYVWRLKKSCYGLNDASRNWYLAIKETLNKMGMKCLSGDDAVFYIVKDGKLEVKCLLHVDDFLIGGSEWFHTLVLNNLLKRFTFGKI